jgi:hypothetical protein
VCIIVAQRNVAECRGAKRAATGARSSIAPQKAPDVNALSGSAGLSTISAASGAAKGPGDCDKPPPKLCCLRAGQLHCGLRIESKIVDLAMPQSSP